MAWSTPPVFSDGNLLTAAQLNTLAADLNETAAAKASTSGGYFVATGANSLAQRTLGFQTVTDSETTTSTSYTDLSTAGPAVAATTGPRALVIITAQMSDNTANTGAFMGLDVSGATTQGPQDTLALRFGIADPNDVYRASEVEVYTLTSGSNTFTAKYRVSGGTGTFGARRVTVMPF